MSVFSVRCSVLTISKINLSPNGIFLGGKRQNDGRDCNSDTKRIGTMRIETKWGGVKRFVAK